MIKKLTITGDSELLWEVLHLLQEHFVTEEKSKDSMLVSYPLYDQAMQIDIERN